MELIYCLSYTDTPTFETPPIKPQKGLKHYMWLMQNVQGMSICQKNKHFLTILICTIALVSISSSSRYLACNN